MAFWAKKGHIKPIQLVWKKSHSTNLFWLRMTIFLTRFVCLKVKIPQKNLILTMLGFYKPNEHFPGPKMVILGRLRLFKAKLSLQNPVLATNSHF
jgi:hypothetical protein